MEWEVDLIDGSTVDIEADSLEAAQTEQARLNDEIRARTAATPTPAPTMLEQTGAALGRGAFGHFYPDPVAGLAEMGSAAMQATAQGLDFFGPGTINAALRLGGADAQLPTFQEAAAQVPGSEGGFMGPGTPRDILRGAGGALPGALGMLPVAGRNVATPAGAFMDFLGLGTAKATPAPGVAALPFSEPPTLARPPVEPLRGRPPAMPVLGRTDQDVPELIREGSESTRRMGAEVDPYTGRMVANPAAMESARQGMKPGLVSMIQAATPATKEKLRKMLDIVDVGRTQLRETINRPGDVMGESLLDRFRVVRDTNRRAGEQIDAAANALRQEQLDVQPAVDQFVSDLADMGISLDISPGAVGMGFRGSDIEGLEGPINVVRRMVARMADTDYTSAYDAHRLKRYIDEQVTYGKAQEGLGGRTEAILKRLRHNIDALLDQNFPSYRQANETYSETIGAIDNLQSLAGRRADLTGPNADKDIGILLRRILSNARSRVPIMDNIVEMDRLANKYLRAGGGTDIVPYEGALTRTGADVPQSIDDDILTQALFADELERIFGARASTSLLGDVSKAVERGTVDTLLSTGGGMTGAIGSAVHSGIDYLRGINEDNAMRALRELLEQQ